LLFKSLFIIGEILLSSLSLAIKIATFYKSLKIHAVKSHCR